LAHVAGCCIPLPEEHTLECEGAGRKQTDVACLAAKRAKIDDRPGPFSQEVSDVNRADARRDRLSIAT